MYILLWLILSWQSSGLSTLLHRSPKKKLFSEQNDFFLIQEKSTIPRQVSHVFEKRLAVQNSSSQGFTEKI